MWVSGWEVPRMHSVCLEAEDKGTWCCENLCLHMSQGFLSFTSQMYTVGISQNQMVLFTEWEVISTMQFFGFLQER